MINISLMNNIFFLNAWKKYITIGVENAMQLQRSNNSKNKYFYYVKCCLIMLKTSVIMIIMN